MAPALFFALALLSADPTQAAEAAPTSSGEAPFPKGAPTDDYGFVSWCYGALSAHMAMHEALMPEVEKIERQWTKGPIEDELQSYEEQRIEGTRALAQFRRAMEAAEKASPKPIQMEGVAAMKKGGSIWQGAAKTEKRLLAREWMSWGLPGRCVPTAETLEKKASLLGQALNFNAKASEAAAAKAAEERAKEEAAIAEAAALSAEKIGLRGLGGDATPAVEAAPEPEPAVVEAAPEPAVETPVAVADFVVDADNPQPCPGLLEPTTRDGKAVLVCKAQ